MRRRGTRDGRVSRVFLIRGRVMTGWVSGAHDVPASSGAALEELVGDDLRPYLRISVWHNQILPSSHVVTSRTWMTGLRPVLPSGRR